MASVNVCMPWRSTPERRPAHRRVHQFWRHADIEVIEADSTPHRAFNICQARNKAVKASSADVVIVADADTLPDLEAVTTAVESMQQGLVIWPYTTYRHLPAELVDETDLLSATPERVYHNSVGGLFVCQRATYWQLGGMDERFHGWGYDDNAFSLVAETLGTMSRLPAVVYSFNHPQRRDTTHANPNKQLYARYLAARGNAHAMLELISR